MRYENFTENKYYCVSGRGTGGEKIFIDDQDKARFVFLITHFQSPIRIFNVSWYAKSLLKRSSFNTKEERKIEIHKKRDVNLVAFVLMPDHFHILVKNLKDQILSVYMHRVLTSYSKYFNNKYNRRGHVFDGPFKAVFIKNGAEILHLSAYIHKKPKGLAGWENTYENYPYSSYQDYIGLNRWGDLLSPDIVLKQFKNQAKYKDFVVNTNIKRNLNHLHNEIF